VESIEGGEGGQGARGDHGAPLGGFGMARGGLWRQVRVLRRVVVVGDGGGGAPIRRRGGNGAREVERLQAHQKVPEIGVGLARSGLSAAARAAAELGYDGEGAPVEV